MMPPVGAMQNGMRRQLALQCSSGKSCQRAVTVQMWVSYPMHPHLLSPCWAAGRPVVTTSNGATGHCLSPYDYIKNTGASATVRRDIAKLSATTAQPPPGRGVP